MKKGRRGFIKTIGLGTIAAIGIPEFVSANAKNKLFADCGSLIPNKDGKQFVFLFQGDSITDAGRSHNQDWNHILGQGYAYLIASKLWYKYTNKNLMFYNRGASGNTVKDLDARWQEDTLSLKPDVLSILVGINDVGAIVRNENPHTLEEFEATYTRLLDRTIEALPNTLIILCEPFILPVGVVLKHLNIRETETRKRQEVVQKLAIKYNTLYLRLQSSFDNACKRAPADYWIWDGVHPMPAGHELIALDWLDVVKNKIEFIK